MRRFSLIDRYILRQLAGWYAATIGVVVFLLWMETMPRLLDQLAGVSERMPLLLRSLISLLPEYVAVAVPLALFLSTAVSFRRLALAGELDVLSAVGIGNWRLIRQPLLVGLLSGLLVISLRGYLQPAGERSLDAIGRAVKSGKFGFGLDPGVAHRLGPGISLFFARSDASRQTIENVALDGPGFTALAASATVQPTLGGSVLITFRNGTIITPSGDQPRLVSFRQFTMMTGARSPPRERNRQARDRMDRIDLHRLFGPASDPGLSPAMMRASAAARLAAAFFCLVVPIFGFVLGIPPKRSRSSIGIGVGIVAIILFWRLSALIESRFAAQAFPLHAALLLAIAMIGLQLLRYQDRNGPGAVEGVLARWAAGTYRAGGLALGRFRRLPAPAIGSAGAAEKLSKA